MIFLVYDASGKLRHLSASWPMARAALDFLVMADAGCPRLVIRPEEAEENEKEAVRFHGSM